MIEMYASCVEEIIRGDCVIFKFFIFAIMAHAIADFALQSPTMAKKKVRNNDIADANECGWKFRGGKYQLTWFYWLSAHAIIHGAVLYILTGYIWIALLECFFHFIIDCMKCEGLTDIHKDQGLHLLTKILYMLLLLL